MSTTPVNIEASDKRVERSPAFLRHFWPGFDPPTCEIIASRQPQHLLPPSIVPVILYLSKKDRGRRVRGERRKNEKRRRKRWNESPVSKTSSLFIRSERLQLSDYAIYKRARYIESPMEEKRSREMQVDNDAGGYTGWVRAKKLEVEGWVKEIDIIWFILFYYFFFRESRRYSKMSVLFNGINFIDSMQNVIRKGLSFFNEKFVLIWIF